MSNLVNICVINVKHVSGSDKGWTHNNHYIIPSHFDDEVVSTALVEFFNKKNPEVLKYSLSTTYGRKQASYDQELPVEVVALCNELQANAGMNSVAFSNFMKEYNTVHAASKSLEELRCIYSVWKFMTIGEECPL